MHGTSARELALSSVGFLLVFSACAVHSPKQKWWQKATEPLDAAGTVGGAWWYQSGTAPATEDEHIGKVCDDPASSFQGCVAVWVADHGDPFTAVHLPTDQQDNFINTLHYEKALLFSDDNMGLRAGSLPIPGVDWHPTCYIADLEVDGVTRRVLGYEETEGDKLVPCPGAREGLRFTEAQINGATDEELQVMCNACYQSVCSGDNKQDPRGCADASDGGVDIGDAPDEAHLVRQVSTSYHCHLTMAPGACDFLQFNQHVSNDYLMESGVLCGWERVLDLGVTHCDCTKEAGTFNKCHRSECLEMAVSGVVCGNCGGCSHSRAYEGIFDKPDMPDANEGTCGHALKMKQMYGEASEVYQEAKRLCAKGLFCRSEYAGRSAGSQDSITSAGCVYYCDMYGAQDPERCGAR